MKGVRTLIVASAVALLVTGSMVGASAATSANKSPILIASMSSDTGAVGNQPGIRQSLNAIIEFYNKQGGINGHPIELKFCDHKLDPNLITQCAQDIAASKSVALVGAYSNQPSYFDILARVGIPSIEGIGSAGASVLTARNSYPVGAGAAASNYGLAEFAKKKGYKDISVVVSAFPTSKAFADSFRSAAVTNNLKLGNDISVPATLTDMSSIVAQSSSADAAYVLLPPNQVLGYLQAAKQSGSKTPLIMISGLLQQSMVDQTGGASSPAEKALVGDYLPAGSDPAFADFRKAVKQYKGAKDQIDLDNSAVKAAWVTFRAFKDVAEGIKGDVTAETMTKALDADADVDLGFGPPLDFTKLFTAASAPRLFARSVYPTVVKKGKFAPAGGAVDVSKYYK